VDRFTPIQGLHDQGPIYTSSDTRHQQKYVIFALFVRHIPFVHSTLQRSRKCIFFSGKSLVNGGQGHFERK